jgi:hypothetical protein
MSVSFSETIQPCLVFNLLMLLFFLRYCQGFLDREHKIERPGQDCNQAARPGEPGHIDYCITLKQTPHLHSI